MRHIVDMYDYLLDEKILLKTKENINFLKTNSSNELFAVPEFITR